MWHSEYVIGSKDISCSQPFCDSDEESLADGIYRAVAVSDGRTKEKLAARPCLPLSFYNAEICSRCWQRLLVRYVQVY